MQNKELEQERIAKRLVEVFFGGRNMSLTYLCDKENIKVGDLVTVEGKLEEQIGVVEGVLKSFKIPKFEMKWISEILDRDATGDYFKLDDDIVSFNSTLTSEKFCTMYLDEKYKSVQGVGDADLGIKLNEFDARDFAENDLIALKGEALYKSNAVPFISLRDGIGKAYVRGSQWYEIDFQYKDGKMTYLACECPYFGNCKHEVALILKVKDILKKLKEYENSENFVVCQKHCFYSILSVATGEISIK